MSQAEIAEAVEKLKESRAEQQPEPVDQPAEPLVEHHDDKGEPSGDADYWQEKLRQSGDEADALEVLSARREEAAAGEPAELGPAAESEPEPSEHGDEPAVDGAPVWSSEDLGIITETQKAGETLRNDMLSLAKAFGGGEDQLAGADFHTLANSVVGVLDQIAAADPATLGGGDKGRGAAAKVQAKEAADEIRQRYGAITEAAGSIEGKATRHALTAEKGKLLKAMPQFDASANAGYLRAHKFTNSELSGITDHRLLLIAEKARLWDESQKGRKKVPVMRKGAKPKAEPKVSLRLHADFKRALQSGDVREVARLQPMMPKRSKEPQTADEARANLKRTGTVHDAVVLLKMRRQAG